MMVLEKDLAARFKTGVHLFPYVHPVDASWLEGRGVRIQLTSFEEFLRFCDTVDVDVVFYCYTYLDESVYHVTDDMIREVSTCDAEFDYIKVWADKENARFDKKGVDVSRPIGFVVEMRAGVGYSEVDDWFGALGVVSAKERLDEFCEKHEGKLLSLAASDSTFGNLMDLQNSLEDVLLSDKEFRLCKNRPSRISYLRNFLKTPENEKYLLLGGRNRTVDEKFRMLVDLCDRVYDTYRIRCRENKLHLGDALPD